MAAEVWVDYEANKELVAGKWRIGSDNPRFDRNAHRIRIIVKRKIRNEFRMKEEGTSDRADIELITPLLLNLK